MKTQLDYLKVNRTSPAINRLFDLALSYTDRALEAHRRGEKVTWTMGIFEAPFLLACRTFPCSYTELGRLAGIEAISRAEGYLMVPRETCSMVKSTMGELMALKEGFRRILGFGSFCESYNTAFEVMRKEGYDVHFMDTPYNPGQLDPERFDHLVAFIIQELQGTAAWLGEEVDEERLRFEIGRINRTCEKVRRILELRREARDYMGNLDTMFLIVGSGHYFGDPEAFMAVCDGLIAELEEEVRRPRPRAMVPLVWAGGRGQEFGTYKLFDDCNGAIVGWTIPTPFQRNIEEDWPPLEAMARYLLRQFVGGTNRHFRQAVEEQHEKSGARGIIFYGYFGCSFASVDFELMRDYFLQRGIPSVLLEGAFQIGEPSGQTLTKVKAFMELLDKP